ATFPVRFMNRHGGSSRIVENGSPPSESTEIGGSSSTASSSPDDGVAPVLVATSLAPSSRPFPGATVQGLRRRPGELGGDHTLGSGCIAGRKWPSRSGRFV